MTSVAITKPAAPKFFPPRPKPWLVWVMQQLSGSIAHYKCQADVVIDPAAIAQLKQLKSERVVYFSNHPTFNEPVLLYNLSAKLHKPFYYMAAYELFQGAMQHFFQSVGVYSIRRGLIDRQSIKQTIDLLQQPGCHLVIFPEGRCSFQSDRLMAFQPGGIQLAFQALGKLAKSEATLPNLYAVPISIHYRYEGDLRAVVEETLAELEAALASSLEAAGLGTPSDDAAHWMAEALEKLEAPLEVQAQALPAAAIAQLPADAYGRLKRLALGVLQRIEADYRDWNLVLPPLAGENWNGRIDALRNAVLQRCEQFLDLPSPENQPRRDRAYRIQAALADYQAQRENQVPKEVASQAPLPGRDLPVALIERSIERLLNLDSIYDGYVQENPTPERFLDSLARFQRELFQIDQPRAKRNRKAHMTVAAPINLAERWEAYGRDRAATVDQLNQDIRQVMQANLDDLVQAAHPQWPASNVPAPNLSPSS